MKELAELKAEQQLMKTYESVRSGLALDFLTQKTVMLCDDLSVRLVTSTWMLRMKSNQQPTKETP